MKMKKMLLDKLETAQQAIDNKIKENEQYFILFKKEMEAEGLCKKTIEKHLSNAEFFVNDYLNFYEVNDMPYGLKCAFDFFEYFYPRKYLGSPYSCGVMMTSLCKFYKVMAKHNLVDLVETAAFIDEIKDSRKEWMELNRIGEDDDECIDD